MWNRLFFGNKGNENMFAYIDFWKRINFVEIYSYYSESEIYLFRGNFLSPNTWYRETSYITSRFIIISRKAVCTVNHITFYNSFVQQILELLLQKSLQLLLLLRKETFTSAFTPTFTHRAIASNTQRDSWNKNTLMLTCWFCTFNQTKPHQ